MDSTPSPSTSTSASPLSGLVICVTGFSKEDRKLIMDATERLGGEYSPNLHPGCTHLLVKSVGGRKLDHVFKYRSRAGLFVVTFQWFIHCVMRHVRPRESLYSILSDREKSNNIVESCDMNHASKPAAMVEECFQPSNVVSPEENSDSFLFGQKLYIDSDVSIELRIKVMEASNRMGAVLIEQWFVGCCASYVVTEGSSILRYLGHVDNIVTPMWVLKTAKKRCTQRFIRFSADLAREVGMLLENLQNGNITGQEKSEKCPQDVLICKMSKADAGQRLQIVQSAKVCIRKRRNHGMQVSLNAIAPSTLLDSICWSISEPPSTATIYSDASIAENVEAQISMFPDAKDDDKLLETTFSNLSRPINESEKNELIFRHHLISILFPVDRFSEMGPSSRTFYSEKGFTCSQILGHIYDFYQEHMSGHEVEAAIHTDSRHADRLRAMYSDKQTAELGYVVCKRIDFMGSLRSFEMLKRISGDNMGNVYGLVIRA